MIGCVYNGESINNGMDYWNGGLAFLLKSSIQVIFKPGVCRSKAGTRVVS